MFVRLKYLYVSKADLAISTPPIEIRDIPAASNETGRIPVALGIILCPHIAVEVIDIPEAKAAPPANAPVIPKLK